MTLKATRYLVGPLTLGAALFGGAAVVAAAPTYAAAASCYGPSCEEITEPVVITNTPVAAPAPPASSSTGLAFTGTDAVAATAVGAGAIGLGGFLVLGSRKRRRSNFA